MTKPRIAIIGLGMAVAPHAKSLIDLVGARRGRCRIQPDASPPRGLLQPPTACPVPHDLDAIFADRTIDAVMILTPPNTHLDLVRRAAAAGKHILLEKPLEISIDARRGNWLRQRNNTASRSASSCSIGSSLQAKR